LEIGLVSGCLLRLFEQASKVPRDDMKLHLFFKGRMAKEPVSSAFLATLLEQRAEIRSALFDMLAECVGSELAEIFKTKQWTVAVEQYGVDIRLDATDETWVILLENKVQSGAIRKGQLSTYYREQIIREPRKSVVAVFLAPGARLGEREVTEVQWLDKFRERNQDFASRISWDTVAEFLETLPDRDGDGEFISSGIDSIKTTIEELAKEKFPNTCGREQIHHLALKVRERLSQRHPQITLGSPWRGRNVFTLGSSGTNLTLWFRLVFDAEAEYPYCPIDVFDGEKMRLTMESMLKLSEKARRKLDLKSRWSDLISTGMEDVPGVGRHLLEGKWLVFRQPVTASSDALVVQLTEIGESVLRFVDTYQ
jgi:PD-(D/E)XK nuclease superfamily